MVNFYFSRKKNTGRNLWKMRIFSYGLTIFMSLYDLYLCNPSTESILFMERTYTRTVQQGVDLDFSWKLKKWETFEKKVNFLIWTYNIHEFVRPISGNPSMNSILLLHMKITYIGAVQPGLFLIFLENWKISNFGNLWHVSSILSCLQICIAPVSHGLIHCSQYVMMVGLH